MKKKRVKYTICSFGLASILAISGCGNKSQTTDSNSISSGNFIENVEVDKSNEEKPCIKISIFATSEEELVKQLTDLQNDLPLLKENYNLKVLEISGNFIECNQQTKNLFKDVLLSCEDISSLSISRIRLTSEDLLCISDFSNLTNLCLDSLSLEDPSFLANLIGLESLTLSRNPITDISSLDALINLKKLDVGSTHITDFSVIKSMPLLTDFSIFGCPYLNPEFTNIYNSRKEIEKLIAEAFTESYKLEFLNK